MSKLILLRHLQSKWNLENRFTGWVDVPLSQEGEKNAQEVAEKLKGEKIDVVYTSPLARNKKTAELILGSLGVKFAFVNPGEKVTQVKGEIPVFVSPALNERNYGILQGLDKDEMKKKYGEEQVRQWRRGFHAAPPKGESLKDVLKRVLLIYHACIENDLKEGKSVLVVASHNSLRALAKYVENISDESIISLEIPSGGIIFYEFGENMKLKEKIIT